ncbi:hypothetical protein SCHPADRAFT_938883 [Schizopora paradoxa]|uniref:F-box domain-containing protein n=1 Tax=Schizopora paradoxa TaxID=27342 RepID=A0A0H2RTF1_9AGAM|nr:hypothetical protein SCHPADRAFT_938883 [Schizopora paradoxa]
MPPRKRIKVSDEQDDLTSETNAVTKKKAIESVKLSAIVALPNEIFAEIAKHSSPEDLLHLARTCRQWRVMLMSKASKYIWEAAREAHSVPNCPDDLNEPKFADLLFGKGCMSCSASKTFKHPLFEFRTRFPDSIFSLSFFKTKSLYQKLPSGLFINANDFLSLIPNLSLKWGNKSGNYALQSDCDLLVQSLQTLPHGSEERIKYLEERKESTQAIKMSSREMRMWLEDSERQKERSKHESMRNRRAEITKRLTALGYGDEDLDSRFDERDWKWRSLFDNSTPLTERSWKSILPQLEKTIKLRRELKAPQFLTLRRSRREYEMKTRFSQHLPQLENIPRHKLFLEADLLELPVVKELTEEDECRVALTEERWNGVQNVLVQAVADHAAKIEKYCTDAIADAEQGAMDLAKERWYENRVKSWKEMEEAIDAEMRELGYSSDDSGYERPGNMHPDEFEENPDEFHDIDDTYQLDYERNAEGPDPVLARLTFAQSLFERNVRGVKTIMSYAELLRKRATKPLLPGFNPDFDGPVAWCKEDIRTSGQIIDTAVLLLEHLGFDSRTKMAYMSACRDVFFCRRCSRGPASDGVTWPKLVEHFIYENNRYSGLCQKNLERDADVPLQNDHSLDAEEYTPLGFGVPVSMPKNLRTAHGGPSTNAGQLYTQLEATWGYEMPQGLANDVEMDEDEPVGIPWGDMGYDSADDLLYEDYDTLYTEKCKLCAKLGVSHAERSRIRLEQHMKRRHVSFTRWRSPFL